MEAEEEIAKKSLIKLLESERNYKIMQAAQKRFFIKYRRQLQAKKAKEKNSSK